MKGVFFMCKCKYCGEPLQREIDHRSDRVCEKTECLEQWLFGDWGDTLKLLGVDCAPFRKDGEWHCPIEGTRECDIYCPGNIPGW
jgi:hypothetical protein